MEKWIEFSKTTNFLFFCFEIWIKLSRFQLLIKSCSSYAFVFDSVSFPLKQAVFFHAFIIFLQRNSSLPKPLGAVLRFAICEAIVESLFTPFTLIWIFSSSEIVLKVLKLGLFWACFWLKVVSYFSSCQWTSESVFQIICLIF